jgi:hypothetical protein
MSLSFVAACNVVVWRYKLAGIAWQAQTSIHVMRIAAETPVPHYVLCNLFMYLHLFAASTSSCRRSSIRLYSSTSQFRAKLAHPCATMRAAATFVTATVPQLQLLVLLLLLPLLSLLLQPITACSSGTSSSSCCSTASYAAGHHSMH